MGMKEGARHCDGEFVGRIEMLLYGLPHESMVAGRIVPIGVILPMVFFFLNTTRAEEGLFILRRLGTFFSFENECITWASSEKCLLTHENQCS
jgi:hypothetical protein